MGDPSSFNFLSRNRGCAESIGKNRAVNEKKFYKGNQGRTTL
jgi:hypothetical protein